MSIADTQTKNTAVATTLAKDTTERCIFGNVVTTQTKSEADDMYLKSLNICKPTPKGI